MSRGLVKSERLRQMERLYIQKPYSDIEMAQRLGVDRKTVYRDRLDLELELPFYEESRGHWRIDRKKYLSEIRVNLNEAMALYLAARRSSRQTRVSQPHLASALEKLACTLKQPMAEHLVQAAGYLLEQTAQPERVKVLETLAQAWVESWKVRLFYRSLSSPKPRQHLVSPYVIEPSIWSEGIYLIGYSETHCDLTTFKVERIEAAYLTTDHFAVPDDFDEQKLLKFAWGIWYDASPVQVCLQFRGVEVVRRLKESIWHPSQTIQDLPDGSCVLTAQVGDWRELLPWVRGWGASCLVLEPPDLRQALTEEAQRLARLYGCAEENSHG